jgi:hypothetical protein
MKTKAAGKNTLCPSRHCTELSSLFQHIQAGETCLTTHKKRWLPSQHIRAIRATIAKNRAFPTRFSDSPPRMTNDKCSMTNSQFKLIPLVAACRAVVFCGRSGSCLGQFPFLYLESCPSCSFCPKGLLVAASPRCVAFASAF